MHPQKFLSARWHEFPAAPVCRSLILFAIIAVTTATATAQLTIDVKRPVSPTVEYFGWDLKGSGNLTKTLPKTRAHYENVPANIVRIPIFAPAHAEDGSVTTESYATVLTSLKNILALNSEVKVFASLKLTGGTTFPKWIESDQRGKIFGSKVNRPDPEKYSNLLTDYVEYFMSQDIKIDFFGVMNEVEHAVSPEEYIRTVRLFSKKMKKRGIPEDFRSFKWVGPETFRVSTGVRYAKEISKLRGADTIDIGGAHMYPLIAQENDDAWLRLADELRRKTPLWHTEVHLTRHSAVPDVSNVTLIRNAFAVLGGSNRSGASGFVWWGGGDSKRSVAAISKKMAVEMMLGRRQVKTTPQHPVQMATDEQGDVYQAYRKDNLLDVILIRHDDKTTDFEVNLRGGQIRRILQVDSYRIPGDEIGKSAFVNSLTPAQNKDRTGFVLPDLPGASFTRVKLELGQPPVVAYEFDYENDKQFNAAGGRRFKTFGAKSATFSESAASQFGANVLTVGSSNNGNNKGVGFIYLPTGIPWEPNTRYTMDVGVLDRAGQPNNAAIEFGLWSGLPSGDNGGGVFKGDFTGENSIAPQTKKSLGTPGQLVIASDALDKVNGLADGDWSTSGELGHRCHNTGYQPYSFTTPADLSKAKPMVVYVRAALNGTAEPTGARAHIDRVIIFKEPAKRSTSRRRR